MPRTARSLAGIDIVYHVICRGNDKRAIFHAKSDYTAYLDRLRQETREHRIEIFHYALMPNHIHLIVRVWHAELLAKFMASVNLAYAWHYKKTYGLTGHLWQDRYKSLIIDDDAYLMTCGMYAELNPVRAGIVTDPEAWQWSSYRHYAGILHDSLVTESPTFLDLSNNAEKRHAEYQKLAMSWKEHPPVRYISQNELYEGRYIEAGQKK